jgi:hypothetical protein
VKSLFAMGLGMAKLYQNPRHFFPLNVLVIMSCKSLKMTNEINKMYLTVCLPVIVEVNIQNH